MTRYIVRRLLIALPVLLLVTIIIFTLVRAIPGDPAKIVSGMNATDAEIELNRIRLGLDKPPVVQYFVFLGKLFRGDLGISLFSRLPVSELIWQRLPNTVLLAVSSVFLATVIGLLVGILAAVKQHSFWDYTSTVLVLFGMSVPVFWLGLMLMIVFSLYLGWFPAVGAGTWRHLVLPTLALAIAYVARTARMTRSTMLDVIHQDYIRTARAKGMVDRVVIFRHALKNALIPVVTLTGINLAQFLGGVVFIEAVFAWPGIGKLLVDALLTRDYTVVQGVVLLISVVFILMNLMVDISYAYLDPRIRYT
jgi:ABC-type dipeptide/oligopeptide/nickel transport system permease component